MLDLIPGTLTLKDPSVRLNNASPHLLEALAVAARVFGMFGLPCIVTSGNDGTHRDGSLHYVGKAADFRSKHVREADKDRLLVALKNALGPRFDVLLESRGGMNEHFHVEFDPKG